MGSASAEVKLPDKGLLGQHNLEATAPGMRDVERAIWRCASRSTSGPSSRSRSTRPRRRRSTARRRKLQGHVKYYFGGAAGDVPVKFKVSRRRWIPWWYWRQGQSPKVEIARGDIKTDKTGTFDVEFTAVARSRHAAVGGSRCARRERLHRRGRSARHRRAHDPGRSLAARRRAGDAGVGRGGARVLLERRGAGAQGQGDQPRGAAGRGRGERGSSSGSARPRTSRPKARCCRRSSRSIRRPTRTWRTARRRSTAKRRRRSRCRRCRRAAIACACRRAAARAAASRSSSPTPRRARCRFAIPPIGAGAEERVSAGRARRAARRRRRGVGHLSPRAVARLDLDRASRRARRDGARVDACRSRPAGRRLHRALDRRRRHGRRRRRRDGERAAQGQGAVGQAGRQARGARAGTRRRSGPSK